MARASARLKPIEVPRLAKKPGMHCDGAGLYLRVAPPSAASWVLRYMLDGKARTMGLGPFPEVDLKEARTRALEARRLKADGIDPIETRKAAKLAKRLAAAKAMTFKECAQAYIASKRDGWRNDKHAAQWDNTLKAYAYPIIGDLPVAAIDTGLVMHVLEQEVGPASNRQRLWSAKNETASRVRGRIESVLGWAAARQLRGGDINAARRAERADNLRLPPVGQGANDTAYAGFGCLDQAATAFYLPKFKAVMPTACKAAEANHVNLTQTLRCFGEAWFSTSPPTAKQLQQFDDWKAACAEAGKVEQVLVNEYADLWRAVRWHREHPGQIANK